MGDTPATAKRAAKKRAPKTKPAAEPAAAVEQDVIAPELLGTAKGERVFKPAVPLALIEEEPDFNPRTTFDQQALEELAASIVLHGLNDPLQLRPKPDLKGTAGTMFFLTGGHRRFRAAKMAGLKTVPAFISMTGDALVAAALDNSLREDLNPTEEAKLYSRLMAEKGLSVRGVAEVMSVAQKRVTERLQILEMPEVGQQAIAEGKLPMRDVAFYAGLAKKSILLSTVLCAADVESEGKLGGHEMIAVIERTDGLIAAGQIEAGSKYFKLAKPDVKAAMDELTEAAGDPGHGMRRSWLNHTSRREGLLGVSLYHSQDRAEVRLPDAAMDEGEAVGTVVRFKSGYDQVVAILDQKWLQATLEDLAVKTVEAMSKLKKSTGGGGTSLGGGMSEDEKARRAAEREKDARNREQAKESNAQLGIALSKHLAEVDPNNLDAIKAVCKMLLSPYVSSYYANAGRDDVSLLAAGGLRYLWPEWKVETMTKAKEPKVKVNLQNDRALLNDRFWDWFNAAKTPSQILGRTLQVFAAIHYVDRNEQMSKDRIGESQSLPGHHDVGTHIERLFDKHAPATLSKRKDGKGTVAQDSKTLAEVLGDTGQLDQQYADIEVTEDERLVLVALYKAKVEKHGRYGCNSENDVNRNLSQDCPGVPPRRCGGALNSLRGKALVAGVKAAPYLNDRGAELAGVMAAAEKLAAEKTAALATA